jgi:Tfp pilus assembly protein PilV
MTGPADAPRLDSRGISIVELLVAMIVLSIGVLALASTSVIASRSLQDGREYSASSAVAQRKLDSLTAVGWTALAGASGTDVTNGHAVAWQVQGTNPRTILLTVARQSRRTTVADTFVTYVAK